MMCHSPIVANLSLLSHPLALTIPLSHCHQHHGGENSLKKIEDDPDSPAELPMLDIIISIDQSAARVHTYYTAAFTATPHHLYPTLKYS